MVLSLENEIAQFISLNVSLCRQIKKCSVILTGTRLGTDFLL